MYYTNDRYVRCFRRVRRHGPWRAVSCTPIRDEAKASYRKEKVLLRALSVPIVTAIDACDINNGQFHDVEVRDVCFHL
jgi:hypothetical protein